MSPQGAKRCKKSTKSLIVFFFALKMNFHEYYCSFKSNGRTRKYIYVQIIFLMTLMTFFK